MLIHFFFSGTREVMQHQSWRAISDGVLELQACKGHVTRPQ